MKIVAFGYKKYTGKSSAARFLATEYKFKYPKSTIIRKGFADKVKWISYDLFKHLGLKKPDYYEGYPLAKEDIVLFPTVDGYYKEMSSKVMQDSNEAEHLCTVRDIWIFMGNKFREFYENIWTDYLLNEVQEQIHNVDDLLVIHDLRFPKEADKIKQCGGKLIKMKRNDQLKGNDPAEVSLDNYQDWDYIIDNNGDLNNLYNQVQEIVKDL